MPIKEFGDKLNRESVTFPVFLMQNSIMPGLVGEELNENGASPLPNTVSSMNWPGLYVKLRAISSSSNLT